MSRAATLLLVTLTALGLGGCGPSEDDGRTGTGEARATSPGGADADTAAEPGAAPADPADGDGDTPTPTPQAVATGRRYEALVNAYAPVTARVNFLVAAETLRADAINAGAGADVERERSGIVKIEVTRLLTVLRVARPDVAAVAVADENQRSVQVSMVRAIDARVRALGELRAALVAIPDELVGDREVERLEEQWRASWDESLRAAREATTTMQGAREQLGLEPALEEAIR